MSLKSIFVFCSCSCFLLVGINSVKAQEADKHQESEEEAFSPNKFGVFVGYTWVPSASSIEGQTEVLVVPTFGLDYQRNFSQKLGMATKNEIEFAKYLIEQSHEGLKLEREFAIVTALVVVYEPISKLGIFVGPGVELERNRNFFVIKVGAEYALKALDNWDVALTAAYDFKEIYSTFGLGITIGIGFPN